jgi:hypothetical protein
MLCSSKNVLLIRTACKILWVSSEKKHDGVNKKEILLSFYIFNPCSDNSPGWPDTEKEALLRCYLRCLKNQLIPALKSCVDKYTEWWSFKIFSPLGLYTNGRLSTYFRPEELINLIISEAEKNHNFESGNSEIILTDENLRNSFNTDVIFVPELYALCLPHINILDDPIQIKQLRDKHSAADLWIETPYDILYLDSTAQFWLHPLFNTIIGKNVKMSYSWKELCNMFNVYLSAPNAHFTAINESMYAVNSNSIFANEIRFRYFHKCQIQTILKQLSKYLGKQSTILTLCPTLKQDDTDEQTAAFIENIMFANNPLLPHISNSVYI